VVYRLFYRLGVIVWQRPAPPADLVELVEGPAALPPGRALDLGCGTGTDTIYLAGHGWQVTAIDMVAKAVAVARRKAAAAGVAPRFVEGDVTRLRDLGIGGGYTLLVDFGCFHTLPTDRRVGYVLGVTDAAAPAATLLLYGFARPPKAAPMHAGITDDEVRQRFTPEWEIISVRPAEADSLGVGKRRADRRFDLRCYQLHRSPPPGSDHPLPENRVTRGAGAVDESPTDSAATSRPLDRDW
jgi:SAM-dependent methyltransferase